MREVSERADHAAEIDRLEHLHEKASKLVTALDRELTELRSQVVELCEKRCGTMLSLCNTGEALSVIAGTLDVLKGDRMKLIAACNEVVHHNPGLIDSGVAKRLNEVVREVCGY